MGNDSKKNYKVIDSYLILKESVAPETPDSDESLLYTNSLGDLIYQTDSYKTNLTAARPMVFVSKLSDFPEPVNNVITLPDLSSYFVTASINLNGNRIQSSSGTSLLGPSSEVAEIYSTLDSDVPLFSGIHTLSLRNISLRVNDSAKHIDLDGSMNSTASIDWHGVNFYGGTIGKIKTFTNIIIEDGAWFNLKDGLTIDGEVGTIGVDGNLFGSINSGGCYIKIPSSTNITRRFRAIYSAFSVNSGATGIFFDTGASVPVESYFLDTVNFSGSGVYLNGVDYLDNKANFSNCRGINNSTQVGVYYVEDNITETTISNNTNYFKIVAATTAGEYNQKFTNGNNRLTYTGQIKRTFQIQCVLSVSGSSNDIIKFRIAKNGETILSSQVSATLPAGGRSENVTIQCVTELSSNDYIEIFARNSSAARNIAATDINVLCKSI